MMAQPSLETLLKKFDAEFDTSYEDQANRVRGEFLKAFPLKRLPALTLEEYVIGTKKPTFCAFVEAKTRLWANILGATSLKFGVYYGHTKTDPRVRYRFAHKYGRSVEEAFDTVKKALIGLIDAGKSLRFGDIDENPLSQLFKAKILSLYFPDKYLNVCSADHIEELSKKLGLPSDIFVSEQQHELREAARNSPIMTNWSNPKVMTFLYNTFIRPNEPAHLKKVQSRRHTKIDIDDLLEKRKRIGEMSEKFALDWERERLIGLGHAEPRIKDCRNTPSCGYDFFSDTTAAERRFIEVKTAGRNHVDKGFRFFLSETEYKKSQQADHRDRYYIYLVFYKDKAPDHLEPWKAADLYKIAKFDFDGYVVSFDREGI
jgi:Protein NO VEIN, C-terminal